jgi:diketogulonate reductase-like aldo/keto reductase
MSKNAETMTILIRSAFEQGYRHIDTALFYDNHAFIGAALTQIFSEGKFTRDQIFITTKIMPFKKFNALEELGKILKVLNLEYIDQFLIHFPTAPPINNDGKLEINAKPMHILWAEMEGCYKAKLTRSIGVSNYNV